MSMTFKNNKKATIFCINAIVLFAFLASSGEQRIITKTFTVMKKSIQYGRIREMKRIGKRTRFAAISEIIKYDTNDPQNIVANARCIILLSSSVMADRPTKQIQTAYARTQQIRFKSFIDVL